MLRDFDTYRKIKDKYEVSEEQIFNMVPGAVPVIQTHNNILAKRVRKEVGSVTSAVRGIM
jgi:hypothetical protein